MPKFEAVSSPTLVKPVKAPKLSNDDLPFIKHPYLSLATVCFLVNAFFDVTGERITTIQNILIGAGLCVVFAVAYLLVRFFTCGKFISVKNILMPCAAVLLFIAVFTGYALSDLPILVLFLSGLVILLLMAVYWNVCGKLDSKKIAFLIIAAGFLLRLIYILYTPAETRQHDVWTFGTSGNNYRHADYIEFFFYNNGLPQVNPVGGLSQFYHPPLHHIIAGLSMRFNVFFGMSFDRAVESIQVLTLFYSSACMITAYKIAKRLSFSDFATYITTAIVAFHPTFIIMSGSVNNDILSVSLALGAILAVIIWQQNKTIKTIIPVALCIGGSMMAKLSGALVAPAIAIVFLIALINIIKSGDKNKLRGIITQFAVFAVICIPLGLWWQVRCNIKYGMPLTYVPALSETSGQFVGGYSAISRLFDINGGFKSIFISWSDTSRSAAGFNEYNCLLALLKSSMFGEFGLFFLPPGSDADQVLTSTVNAGYLCSVILFAINAVIVAVSLIAMVKYVFFDKERLDVSQKLLFFGVWAVVIFSYVSFCFKYPQTCTQNMRYAVPTILTGALFTGMLADDVKKRNTTFNRIIKWSVTVCTVLFCATSSAVYCLLSLV